VVIVNYDGWEDVDRLVASLAAAPELATGQAELVVVDNASPGPIPSPWDGPEPPARLVVRSENGGFAAGVNAGWRATRGRWLLLLNPDVIAGADLLGRVLGRIEAIEALPEVQRPAIVGFALKNPDGSLQPSAGAEPTMLRLLIEPFFPRARRKYLSPARVRPGPVPWVTGACVLVARPVLERLNGLDETYFLYYEEVALCREARRLGYRVEFDPGIAVVHLRPLQNRPPSPALRLYTRHGRLVYFRGDRSRWRFGIVAGLTWLEAHVRGAWAGLNGRSAERRAWQAVGRIARDMAAGRLWRGPEVRDLAAAVVGSTSRQPQRPKLAHVSPGKEAACPQRPMARGWRS
jgi:GT2 family glycosyltransferase